MGQGNGAGPQIWAVVSTPVLNMLREEGYGAFFEASISGERLTFVGYAFVDDTDLVTNLENQNASYREVAVSMQESLTAWEGGIRAMGGAIEPEKSHWYLIDFVWQYGTWRYATVQERPAILQVKDCNGVVKVFNACQLTKRNAHWELELPQTATIQRKLNSLRREFGIGQIASEQDISHGILNETSH